MREMTAEERLIYNDGERLIPGVTHMIDEDIRHRSSYEFFVKVIESDFATANRGEASEISVLDLGAGVGHGSVVLSRIPRSRVVGIDVSRECLEYAERHYNAKNITYEIADIAEYVGTMESFDYVVSRGVIEHVRNGIEVARSARWRKRLMIDLPYDEPEDFNHHHLVCGVTAKDFETYPSAEIFYEENSGKICGGPPGEPPPNMIMCVASSPDLPPASSLFPLPLSRWDPDVA